MTPTPDSTQPPVKPLLTKERMEEILSARQSISSEEFYHQVEQHLGRPLSLARKTISVNGQSAWVCC